MPHPKVSAAEKYAEIGGRENAPECEHGLKKWHAYATCRAGGRWKCDHANESRVAVRQRAKRVAAGLCGRCGKRPLAVDSTSKCAKCLTVASDNHIKVLLRSNGVEPEQIYKEMGWDET